jgi:eukaryotic-like serine/threonine-protein kinase
MSFRERLEWMMRMGLLIFVLAAAAFLSAITTIRIAIRGREVQMPNIVGMKLTNAQRTLGSRGLGLKIADRVYDAAPSGNVIRQSPAEGMEMKVSQDAHVVLSLGALRVTIPNLEGQSLRSARVALIQSGLQLGEVSAPYMPDTSPELVLVQTPPAGAQAASAHVDLLAPEGPHPAAYVMPFVIGMTGPEAQRQFTQFGFKNVHLDPVPAPQWPVGSVLDQTPSAGSRVAADDTIELKIASRAAPDISIPHSTQ